MRNRRWHKIRNWRIRRSSNVEIVILKRWMLFHKDEKILLLCPSTSGCRGYPARYPARSRFPNTEFHNEIRPPNLHCNAG